VSPSPGPLLYLLVESNSALATISFTISAAVIIASFTHVFVYIHTYMGTGDYIFLYVMMP
jgi:hypothetical protein